MDSYCYQNMLIQIDNILSILHYFIVDQEFLNANLFHLSANKTLTSQDWFIASKAKQ